MNELQSNLMDMWKAWKDEEERNRSVTSPRQHQSHANCVQRLVYAWVYVDLEMSLLHDVPPVLSINDLIVPLPHDASVWHANSYESWLERYEASGAQFNEEMQSLNSLFRSFIQGRLTNTTDLPFHHLRLLLHPLQAMVLEQQQLLRIFGIDEPSNRHRVLSRLKVLSRLQETQDLLHQMSLLLTRSSNIRHQSNDLPIRSTICVSMLMFHLISLNTITSIPEIERIANEEPPTTPAERAEAWRHVRYAESEHYIVFHAGQILRLVNELHSVTKLPWWPIAAYRAAMVCWSLSGPMRLQEGDRAAVSIHSLLPNDGALESYVNDHRGLAVFTYTDGRQEPVLEGNNSLHYCIDLLSKNSTRLVRNTQAKLVRLAEKWSL
jgi:hypothetical protein